MAKTDIEDGFTDPRRHGTIHRFDVELSGESWRTFVGLVNHWQAQDGQPWTIELALRKVLEEFAMNHPDVRKLEVAGELPMASRELLKTLAKKYGLETLPLTITVKGS